MANHSGQDATTGSQIHPHTSATQSVVRYIRRFPGFFFYDFDIIHARHVKYQTHLKAWKT